MDLFAGTGGMSLGFHTAGFHVVAAAEWWSLAAQTYLLNLGSSRTRVHFGLRHNPSEGADEKKLFDRFAGRTVYAREVFPCAGTNLGVPRPCEHFFIADVTELQGERVLDLLGLAKGELDCIAGGPPCQGFSIAGKRNIHDPRNSCVFEFARLVLEMQPKTMLMENVPGILSMTTPEGEPVVDAFCRVLEDGGFGTRDALKRMLLQSAGAGAAWNSRKKKPAQTGANSQEFDEPDFPFDPGNHREQPTHAPEQGNLFSEVLHG